MESDRNTATNVHDSLERVTDFLRKHDALVASFVDASGQHSIRINDQFRVCFRWTIAGAEDVEIVDYH